MFIANMLFSSSLEKGENIHYVLHKHPVTIHKKLFKSICVGIILPAVIYVLFPPLKWIMIIWVIIGFIKAFYLCADWYFDAWLITNQGIILSEWNGFFDKAFSRIEYQTVEEVSYAVQGVWPTLLGFGELTISRFGSPHPTTMKKAMKPKKVSKIILEVQEKFIEKKTRRDHENLKAMLAEMVQYSNK